LVEYGNNEILGSLRTEYMSPHLISLRLNEARNKEETAVKKIAFLLDSQAVRVLDLNTDTPEATYSHDCKIDWLELNQRATKLLFRDKRRALHLYDIASQQRITLLNFCNYVQWVPDSDVVVAQSRRQLCIYYSIDNPSDVHTINIKGDVEEIERSNGRTEVIVDEGINTATYALDESLIAFGAAADGKQYEKAVRVLERLAPNAPGAEAMWQQLRKMALEDSMLAVSERCAAALGDISRAEFLKNLNNTVAENGNNPKHVLVRAQLALLSKQFKKAEVQLLQQGQVEAAIDMYRQLHKWEDALAVAESKSHPCVPHLKKEYFEYLISTGQEEVAGDLKQRQGDVNSALKLFLKGGFPAKAADLVMHNHDLSGDNQLCERVADALVKAKQFEKAGEFLEELKIHKRALECYTRGHAYFRAVELARVAFPGQVVKLEEEWGDHLVQQKQMDAASIHYIQAGAYLKAINAAIEAKQWQKAVQILDNLEPATSKPYYKRIAQHYSETKKYADAEKYFIAGGLPQEAVQMYVHLTAPHSTTQHHTVPHSTTQHHTG
jgi:intraflagellar transport protein 172